MKSLRSASDRERVNGRLKSLSGAKPYIISLGKMAVRGRRWRVSASAGARLDPESGRQNVRETVARARYNIKIVKKMTGPDIFWEVRLAKGARDCGESWISYKNRKKLMVSDHFLKMRWTKCARD